MTSFDLSRPTLRNAWPVWLLAALAIVAAFAGDAARLALRYDRNAVTLAGEWWRLASGHVVHLNWGHTALNVAGAALIAVLFGARLKAFGWFVTTLFGALVIGAGFMLRDIDLIWYVGMSGLLHTFFVAGAADEFLSGRRFALGLLLAVAAKLVYEQLVGPLPFTAESAGGPVIVNAHLYGAVGGAVAALVAHTPVGRRVMRASTADR